MGGCTEREREFLMDGKESGELGLSRGAGNLRETYLRVMHAVRMQAWPPPDALLGRKMFHVHVNVLKT